MNHFKFLALASTAVLMAACDGGDGLLLTAESDAADGIETIDFFGMENTDNETIAYEPELGFAVQDRGPLTISTALLGSSTEGQDYRVDCPSGEALVGLEGFESGSQINQVVAKCVEVSSSGNWVGTPQSQTRTVGITSGNTYSVDCTSGHAITGITGLTKNNAIASVQIHCSQLSGPERTTGQSSDSRVVGQVATATAKQLCGSGGVATGIHGRENSELKGLGLVCHESPATAGRWSNPFNWPVQAVHALMTPQGHIMSYGFKNGSGNLFDYDVWNPELGTADSSHTTFASDQGVFSFCNASVVMPGNGNILMPGGTKLNSDNAGVADVPIYDTVTGGLSRAPDMANRRWYPTTVVLPNGEILVAGGRDVAGVATNTPEIYSPDTNEWRSLFGASMAGLSWSYPRLWVASDGRVFGISKNEMYFINPLQSGALQRVGTFTNSYTSYGEATAVMYRPGKILQLGGNRSGGTNALMIDITSGTPEVRPTNDMNLPRNAWANSQILANGEVMAMGGSKVVNDAVTAALNAEIWDPATEEWTVVSSFKWPRLYHSNSVLLKDATVMISGGGNPGPVTNYNAEIFSPPYLYNDDGTPAVRPVIDWAPKKGAYGQQITLNTAASEVAKISFIKTSAVTHSWNVEQRYMELPFSSNDDNSIKVGLPALRTTATPGYYLMFVINQQGTPSEAVIIKLGDEPGVEPEPPVITPKPEPVETDSLLVNGGFEDGKASWFDCADASLSVAGNRANNGEKALTQNSGACLYQEFVVEPGNTYTVICDAFAQNSAYSSISLTMMDPGYTELVADAAVVTSSAYTTYSKALQAPQEAGIGAVTLYSEGPTHYDSCIVITDGTTTPVTPPVVQPPVPPPASSLLVNGDFSQEKSGWYDCSNSNLTSIEPVAGSQDNALKVQNAGCIYQEFAVTAGKQYELNCIARSEGSQYSSISFQMADATYNQLDSKVKVVGPGDYQSYIATLTAPANSATGAVTLYSEDITRVSACYVEEI